MTMGYQLEILRRASGIHYAKFRCWLTLNNLSPLKLFAFLSPTHKHFLSINTESHQNPPVFFYPYRRTLTADL